MPLTHWACPPGKEKYGEIHEPEYCILECNERCMAPGLIAAMTRAQWTNYHKGKYMSATSLMGCVRSLVLKRTIDYADYMKNAYYAYRGDLLHRIAEDAAEWRFADGQSLLDLGFLSENKMAMGFCFKHGGFDLPDSVDPWDEDTWGDASCPSCRKERRPYKDREWFILGGTLDFFEPYWDMFDEETGELPGVLWDYKTMARYALQLFITGQKESEFHDNVKDEHYLQANIYRYLFENGYPPDHLAEKGVTSIKLVRAEIQGIGMNHFPRTGTSYRYKKHWRHDETDWEIPSIDFQSDEWMEEFIREAARPRYESLILEESRGPICEPNSSKKGEHSWQCRFCPMLETEFCPKPGVEWKALQDGEDPETAFSMALDAWEEEQYDEQYDKAA